MGNFFFFLCFGLFCIFVQSNLFLHSFVLPFQFDLTVPLTLYIGLSQSPFRGGLLVFWVGLLLDVCSGGVLGMYTFSRESMFFLIQILKKGFFLEKKISFGALVLVLFFFEAFLVFLLLQLAGKHFVSLQILLRSCFVPGILSLLIWYALYPLVSKLEKISKKA